MKLFVLTAVAFSFALFADSVVSDRYRANEASAADSPFQQVDLRVATDNGSGAAYCGTSDPNPSLYYGGGWWTGWYPDYFFLRWARDHNHDWYYPDPFSYLGYAFCATEFGAPL